MKILVTNDDGIFAEGINLLALALKSRGHSVMIAAPSENQSCVGHSLTLRRAIYADKAVLPGLEDVPSYAVTGTPVDCVRLSIGNLGFDPEIIISGINHAPNLGTDTLYSGTVSAAMEGGMLGYPAIAIAKDTFTADYMKDAAEYFADNLDSYIELLMKNRSICVLSVNIPSMPREQYRGVRAARLTVQEYDLVYDEIPEPDGGLAYKVKSIKLTDCRDDAYDEKCMKDGYVVLTPLTYDITDYANMKGVKLLERDY